MKHLTTILFLAGMLCLAACKNTNNKAAITVNQKGEMTALGQPVADFEAMKALLVDSLVAMSTIPEKLDIHFEGEVGMGTRQEVETIATEAIAAAKLLQKAPTVEMEVFRKEQGSDCAKADEMERTDCAQIDLLFPVVKKGEKSLQDSVSKWTLAYLTAILCSTEETPTAKTLEEASAVFFKDQKEYKGSAMGGAFEARTGSEVVFNNGQYLTLAINGYTYQGGAHGSPTESLNTFEAQTGKILTWDDLVTDQAAVKALAEKKVRETKAEVFADGFNFDETFPFALPVNYGLTKEGLFLYYVPYEIMPYAMGTTEVLLTFEELGSLSKVTL